MFSNNVLTGYICGVQVTNVGSQYNIIFSNKVLGKGNIIYYLYLQ